MNRIKMIICMVFAAMALAACDKLDNPVETPTTYSLDDPQETVTDQPANARTR